jgi:hypothetical protein
MTPTRYPAGMSGNPVPAPFNDRMLAKRQLKRRERELYEPRYELAYEGLPRIEPAARLSVDLGSDRLRVKGTP